MTHKIIVLLWKNSVTKNFLGKKMSFSIIAVPQQMPPDRSEMDSVGKILDSTCDPTFPQYVCIHKFSSIWFVGEAHL